VYNCCPDGVAMASSDSNTTVGLTNFTFKEGVCVNIDNPYLFNSRRWAVPVWYSHHAERYFWEGDQTTFPRIISSRERGKMSRQDLEQMRRSHLEFIVSRGFTPCSDNYWEYV